MVPPDASRLEDANWVTESDLISIRSCSNGTIALALGLTGSHSVDPQLGKPQSDRGGTQQQQLMWFRGW